MTDQINQPKEASTLPVSVGQMLQVDPGLVDCDWQGRGAVSPEDLTPAGLQDLIASIQKCGQLHPCGVVPLPDGRYKLVYGERRLRAVLWGYRNSIPGFETLRVMIVAPPSEPDKLRLQLAENMARSDLSDGDLAQALMYLRCGMAQERLEQAGSPPTMTLLEEPDPVELWASLTPLMRQAKVEAPEWADVISDQGIGITESKAKRVVRAFRKLPRSVSSDLDEEGVSTTARLRIAKFWPELSGFMASAEDIQEAARLAEAAHQDSTPPVIPPGIQDDNISGDGGDLMRDPSDGTPGGGGRVVSTGENPGVTFDEVSYAADATSYGADLEKTYSDDGNKKSKVPKPGTSPCPQPLVDTLLETAREVAENGGFLNEHDLQSLRILFGRIYENSNII